MALEYTLTRAFPSRWFALVTYILVFILVIILSVLNGKNPHLLVTIYTHVDL